MLPAVPLPLKFATLPLTTNTGLLLVTPAKVNVRPVAVASDRKTDPARTVLAVLVLERTRLPPELVNVPLIVRVSAPLIVLLAESVALFGSVRGPPLAASVPPLKRI